MRVNRPAWCACLSAVLPSWAAVWKDDRTEVETKTWTHNAAACGCALSVCSATRKILRILYWPCPPESDALHLFNHLFWLHKIRFFLNFILFPLLHNYFWGNLCLSCRSFQFQLSCPSNPACLFCFCRLRELASVSGVGDVWHESNRAEQKGELWKKRREMWKALESWCILLSFCL